MHRHAQLHTGRDGGQPAHTRSGQAMLEFIVGIVGMLALLAGLLQLVTLANAHLARRNAGRLALSNQLVRDNPDYIRTWHAGADERTYSRDDDYNHANPNVFRAYFPERVVGRPDDWRVMEAVPHNPIADIRDAPDPADAFGMVSDREYRNVPLLPAVRHLLYRADRLEIESEVWMTATYGIY